MDLTDTTGMPCEMTWEEFEEKHKPILNHLDDNASLNGAMFETYGPELDFVVKCDKENPLTVWTFMDDGEGGTFIGDGFQHVNRIGYLVTEVPAIEDVQYVVDHDRGNPEEDPE